MRFPPLAALCLPLALAACSSGEDEAAEGALDSEEIASQLEQGPTAIPGEYRTTATLLEFEIAGVPEAQAESVRSMLADSMEQPATYCLTQEEADRGPGEMLQKMAESDCTVTRLDTTPDSISGEMQCSGEGGLNGSVTVDGTMRGETSTMVFETIHSVPGIPGEGARLKMQVESRRIGECAG